MLTARTNFQVTRLGSGQVLFTGGQDAGGNSRNSAEIYDPVTQTFSYTTQGSSQTFMTVARSGHTASLLYDGTVLLAGGQDTSTDTLSSMEIYNPVTGTFSTAGVSMQAARHNQTATLLPTAGLLIAGGTNTTSNGDTVESSAELYSPYTLQGGLHPRFMVANIQYAPPGSGSTLTYSNASTVGTSVSTENTFESNESLAATTSLNLGIILKISETVTNTWDQEQDSSSTYGLTNVTTDTQVVPGPCSSATSLTVACSPTSTVGSSSIGVDHESDIIWVWLNPVSDYTIAAPGSFVWNGLASDPNDPNSVNGSMDLIPLSVGQLDGTSPISQAEWDILDRNWDPVALGGAGPITSADLLTILARDPFATNLSGVGRSTAPTTAPTGGQYVVFDPNIATLDLATNECGNRYDFAPGFDMTFPFAPLGGSEQQALTQTYQLSTTTAQINSQSVTDTYKAALSNNFSWTSSSFDTDRISHLDQPNTKNQPTEANNTFSVSLKATGYVQWTNKWTNVKNNSTLQTQTLSIKNPLSSDNYTGPEQMQVWLDNLYGTYMFYPKPSDTNWILTFSQNTLTAYVTADPHIPHVPTGTVTFYDGCTVLGSGSVNESTGSVSISASLTTSGTHAIVAIYSGDTNFYHNNSNTLAIAVQ
jgi:hypothetical protein